MSEIGWWQGSHGDEYTERNDNADIDARVALWAEIMGCIGYMGFRSPSPSILEIGAGGGVNLDALALLGYRHLRAVEPNAVARQTLINKGFTASGGTAANPSCRGELVFTSGVLIHVPPNELLEACQGIYDAAERHIVCIEYFSADPEEKEYRGRKLWKRDFGSFWLDNFDLKPLGCGFAWKRTTGLDNLTYWIFEKCD